MHASNKSPLNILYFNARSLLPKIDNLRILSSVYSPDIICVVETWLDTDILDSEIAIQGYTVIRLDRNRHGGGILIFVNTTFTYSLNHKGSNSLECIINFFRSFVISIAIITLILLLLCCIDPPIPVLLYLTHCFVCSVV